MAELEDRLSRQIQSLCERGDKFANQGDYASALEHYWQAWGLLPEPKTEWHAATWILAAIGDANFLGGDYQAGKDNLTTVMHCPDAIDNPFLHLRLGQCHYELGQEEQAAEELTRAYALEGAELFATEDPKYLKLIKAKLKPPPGGWPDEKPAQKPWWKIWGK
jgi:tetratricopeptide (TPR) repeat protein